MSGDAVALPDESPLWDAHDHPDRQLDHGAVLCSCVTCEAMILAQAERTPGIGIALATRCDRIVVAAEYLAEVMSVDRTLTPLLYVRDDYVRRMYLPVDGWWFVPPRRWWSEACHEDEAAAGRRHPRHRVAKRQSDANRRPWHVTAAGASARATIVASSVKSENVSSATLKHETAPVWHAGPAGSTSASTASASQSDISARTRSTLPLVPPLCHSPRVRER